MDYLIFSQELLFHVEDFRAECKEGPLLWPFCATVLSFSSASQISPSTSVAFFDGQIFIISREMFSTHLQYFSTRLSIYLDMLVNIRGFPVKFKCPDKLPTV